ncbi:hypothetical protein CVT25_012449 [Psilocybe cyanescens]|uniref:CxC5 like cysteine cluster associated with KDZ domain-containing protein n=1 Tax=Psilocybe cyanescens TaxID=93625 RepID=A0A409XC79_PSICY|nr:hypothetical protein CVT25_012449 [Psilocybe cyanescens]
MVLFTVYPPDDGCTNTRCPHQIPLKKVYRKVAAVFTQGNSVQPAYNTSLYCPKCATSYHANYLVNGGCRTYHPGIPDLIQVGEHQFVEAKPIETWQANMLFGWFSASNASRVFESAMNNGSFEPSVWGMSSTLMTNQVRDAFIILCLLEDAQFRGHLLIVPHTGDQSNRFKAAMEDRN